MSNKFNSVLICGNTKHLQNILDMLFSKDSPEIYTIHQRLTPQAENFTIISDNQDILNNCKNKYNEIKVDNADASDDEVLINHGIKTSRAIIISYEDDRENLLITLTTRQLNPSIKIIVTCSMVETMRPKLIRAGADSIISPSNISGLRMASQLIRPNTTDLLDSFLQREDNHFTAQEIIITKSDQNIGTKIIDSEYAECDLLILAISRDDTEIITYNPHTSYQLQIGDVLLVLGTITNFQRLSPYTQYHLQDLEIDSF